MAWGVCGWLELMMARWQRTPTFPMVVGKGSLKTSKWRETRFARFQAALVCIPAYRSIKFSPSSRCSRAKIKPENKVKPPIAKKVQRNAVCTLPETAGSDEK